MKLHDSRDALADAHINVVAISYDSPETLAEFADLAELDFPLLADPDSKAIDAYGIRNQDVKAGSGQDGVPHPGTFVIDSDGIVLAKIFYSVAVRHSSEELIKTVDALSRESR